MNTGPRRSATRPSSPFGGSGSLRNASSLPTSRSAAPADGLRPSRSATRCGVPNRLPSTGIARPSAVEALRLLEQERRAAGVEHAVADLGHLEGEDQLRCRCASGSPRCSSCAMKSRRSEAYFIFDATLRCAWGHLTRPASARRLAHCRSGIAAWKRAEKRAKARNLSGDGDGTTWY